MRDLEFEEGVCYVAATSFSFWSSRIRKSCDLGFEPPFMRNEVEREVRTNASIDMEVVPTYDVYAFKASITCLEAIVYYNSTRVKINLST